MAKHERGAVGMRLIHLALLAVLLTAAGSGSRGAVAQEGETAFPPHRVAGNLYYVGSQAQASYLVTTPEGHVLINSCFAETVPLIQASVKKLGFRFADVRVLLTSHAHNDHVAGSALVRRLTGAKVMVMEGDDEIVRTGGKADFQYSSTWEPCPVDRVLRDGDTVKLGGSTLVAHKTPGHTRGCTTWTMEVREGEKRLQAVIIGSPNVNPGYRLVGNTKYPTIAEDFARTFQVLKSLPCDLFLGAHGEYYGLTTKYERLQKEAGNPFIDPKGYWGYVRRKEKAFRGELARQKAE
jgi:metallo-beta-lactamase class B